MATELSFIEYICEQLDGIEDKCFKKMFGEYMVYVKGKPVFCVCDNTVFVKINSATDEFFGVNGVKAYPYNGASLYYVVENIDDREYLTRLALLLEKVLPLPKKRTKKS